MKINPEEESKEILRRYRGLLRAANNSKSREDRKKIRKAFDLALECHSEQRRKSGEPYIYHPISVAKVVAGELGLDTTSIVCALLHDTVEDTKLTLEEVENLFGEKEKDIVNGLTKMSGVFEPGTSAQAENFRKMLLTLSSDVRVILIKLADRLDNMRTLTHMSPDKQQKIASETLYMYAPLAHRLGLHAIKSELEDLSLKYKEAEEYDLIQSRLRKTKAVRARFIRSFCAPIKRELDEAGIKYEIKGRPKSIFSIWSKMEKQKVSFEEVYDVFAVRIVINTERAKEKMEIWRAYSIVTDFYQPNPDRLRDWISLPKRNGYESLHTTVMSPTGKWVEIQIRSERMDEIAEKGFAAHWKYKEGKEEKAGGSQIDNWLGQIREILESGEDDALAFIDDFKMDLKTKDIYVFTPNGDMKTLPKGATTLDFAFLIHSKVGSECIGGKVNHKLVPLSYELKSGDQIEIITSRKQTPKEDWLGYVVTTNAKQKIRHSLKEAERSQALDGREIFSKWAKKNGLLLIDGNIESLFRKHKFDSAQEMYFRISVGSFELDKLKGYKLRQGKFVWAKGPDPGTSKKTFVTEKFVPNAKEDTLLIGESLQKLDYTLANCCSPIAGDNVFGFITVSGGIKVHRKNCPNATNMLSKYAYRMMKAKWSSMVAAQFEVKIAFTGIDNVGLVKQLTTVISDNMKVNMKSISMESRDGVFEGSIKALVTNTSHLKDLMTKLKNVSGVHTVERVDEEV
ncbi:MAG: bifunctional (p)ppGpp synthetase/guanosine-3',5'-bis(diphosphate) 3'-pyrophosphohydrolase [Flavobacteriales bacterium]|nr:bifunctional (p)ppGpp synthetase/guanosine-3',5'-bis(diphosphate) 3'-pyrophosphohydrolase [Flavobacteriales bacterium]